MPVIINTNISSLNAQRHLGITSKNLNKSYQKLNVRRLKFGSADILGGNKIKNRMKHSLSKLSHSSRGELNSGIKMIGGTSSPVHTQTSRLVGAMMSSMLGGSGGGGR